MGKTAFIFPGQGAQYVGMAKGFYDNYDVSREVFDKASEAAGYSLQELCFDENERINETEYTQPALVTACCAILKALESEGLFADMTAGLSLGEYCALAAAGAMDMETAVKVVCRRGKFMAEAVPSGKGAMAAIITKKPIPIEEICAEIGGIVGVANYNSPGQQVISGEAEAVKSAGERLKEAGALRAVPLKVSGPFHSPMLAEAGNQLREFLETVEIAQPKMPFISNVTAEAESKPERLKELLGKQVCSPVRWQQSVEYMIKLGADTFVEIGPGKSLSGFIKKIAPAAKMINVETPEDIEKLKAEMRI